MTTEPKAKLVTVYYTPRGRAYHRYSKCHRITLSMNITRTRIPDPGAGASVTLGGRELTSCDDCGQ